MTFLKQAVWNAGDRSPMLESDRQYLFKSNKPFNNFYVLPANTSPNTFMRAVDAASQEIVIFSF